MATKAPSLAITLPDKKELEVLPKFTVAAADLATLNAELSQLELEARNLKITDKPTYDRATAINDRQKEIVKEADGIVTPYKTPLRKWLDFVQTHFNVVKNHAEQMKGILTPKMEQFVREDARRVELEKQQKEKELADKKAKDVEAKRQADIKAAQDKKRADVAECKRAYAAGEITKAAYIKQMKYLDAEAETAKEQAELNAEAAKAAPPPQVTVKSEVSQGRTYYYAEVVDPQLFMEAVIKRYNAGQVEMLKYLLPNEKELSELATRIKNDNKTASAFPGIKAWSKKSF